MSMLRQAAKVALDWLTESDGYLTRGWRLREDDDSSATRPAVSLTFDDGPHPEYTPRLLDALAQAEMRATFFVIGEKAERYPNIVRRIDDEGHDVGNHTWTHSEPRGTNTRKFLQEVQRTEELIQGLTSKSPRLVRPPKGELSFGKLTSLLRADWSVVLWNRDSKDYLMNEETEMQRWANAYRPKHGDFVLLHDRLPHAITAVETLAARRELALFSYCPVFQWLRWPELRNEKLLVKPPALLT